MSTVTSAPTGEFSTPAAALEAAKACAKWTMLHIHGDLKLDPTPDTGGLESINVGEEADITFRLTGELDSTFTVEDGYLTVSVRRTATGYTVRKGFELKLHG